MACDYVYKGKTLTKQELEQYLKDNPQEVSEILTSLNSNTKEDGVKYNLKVVENISKNISKVNQWYKQLGNTDKFWNKLQQNLQIPKQQIELLKESEGNTVEEKLLDFVNKYSFTIEINTAKVSENIESIREVEPGLWNFKGEDFYSYSDAIAAKNEYNESRKEVTTQHYSNLTVPGGTNYTENEIATPAITPSIKGHAQFATDNGIGWFRSDDKVLEGTEAISTKGKIIGEGEMEFFEPDEFEKPLFTNTGTSTKTRRILEVQSDLFQKGRDKKQLDKTDEGFDIDNAGNKFEQFTIDGIKYVGLNGHYSLEDSNDPFGTIEKTITKEEFLSKFEEYRKDNPVDNNKNQFLQLLNKDSNWVTFFIKSIIQDSARKGYEQIIFPSGNTASKVEGHTTLEEFKRHKEDRIKELEEKKKTASDNKPWLVSEIIGSKKHYFNTEEEANEFRRTNGRENFYSATPTSSLKDSLKNVEDINNEIAQLKKELERVEKEGFAALKPIYNFYENTVTNILKKQGYNPVKITDEYGNTWNEVTIENSHQESISFQPNITEEQQQERESYKKLLDELDLTQEEKNKASEIFNETQDLDDVISLQPNITPFDNINSQLINLRDKLEDKYEKWKLSNKHNFGNKEYKEKNLEFYNTIKELNSKIQTLKTENKESVYNYLKAEYQELKDSLDSYESNTIKNENLIDRIDFLHSYITGKNLKGEQTDVWDFSDFPNFNNELFRPVSDLQTQLEDFNNKRVFEIVKNLPSFVFYKKENNFTEEEFFEVFQKSANEKLKDINAAQQYALGLNSNDDSIFAQAIFDLYHSEIAKAKNPMRLVGRRMAELNEDLKKEGFNFDSLKEKNERGVDTLLLTNLYSSKFTKDVLPKFFSLIKDYKDSKDHKSNEKSLAYKNAISWLKLHTDVIDYSKIKSIKDMYSNHNKLNKYFIHSEEDMSKYEAELKDKLGKEYDNIITTSIQKIENFLERDAHEFMYNQKYYDIFYYENNPFEFVKNYNSKNAFSPIEISKNFYRYNMSSHIEYIPKSTTTDINTGEVVDTGYYNKSFIDDIMSNDKAYELWKLMIDSYRNYINSTYIESGQNINSLSWGKINNDLADVIMDNYKSASGIAKIGKAMVDTWKDSWYFTQQSGDPKRLKDNYFDTSVYEVSTYTNALMAKSLESLKQTAKEKNIPVKLDSEITTNRIGTEAYDRDIKKYKYQLANDIALKNYSESKSGDIVKITLALMELSAIQRARIEGQLATEMLLESHKQVQDKYGRKGGRTQSNAKVDNWVAVNIYNTDTGAENVEATAMNKTFGKRLNEFERNLKNILESLLEEFGNGEDLSFHFNSLTYKRVKGVYQVFSKDNTMTNITEEEFQKELENYIDTTIKGLGTPMTVDSVINGFISNMTKKAFLINPISGAFNRFEGKFTNMINDWTGTYWTPGNNDYSEKFLTFANILKMSPKSLSVLHKNHYLQLQTLQHLIEEMNILQDRKNEVEKKEKESNFGKVRKFFNWFAFAIDNPEFKNQATIILNMLQDVKVKDNNGNEYDFFDKKTSSFTIYKPGTLELKPNFTKYNQNFSNFLYDTDNVENNKMYIVKERISDAISQIQGNYSNVDSVMIRHQKGWGGVAWGKILTTFMRWFPSHVNQRFGVRNQNYLQNKKDQKGRYRILWDNPYVGTTYISSVLAITLAPSAFIFSLPMIAGLAKVAYNKFVLKQSINLQVLQIRTLAGFLQETLLKTIGLPLKMLKVTALKDNKLNNAINNFSDNTLFGGMSEQDRGAVKAMAQELAIQLNILFVMLLLKALLHGGSGDDDDEKMLHNFIDNNGNRLINNLAVWSNPAQLVSDNTQFALLRSVKNIYKMTTDMWKISQGDKIDGTRPIMNLLKEQPFLPIPNVISKAIVKEEYPGLDSKEYQSSQWFDRYTKTAEWRNEQQYKKKRADYKEAYTDYLKEIISEDKPSLTDEQVEDIVDKQVRSKMNKKDMRRKTDETYEDALKRIDFKQDFEN
jgi:hypothetical protein